MLKTKLNHIGIVVKDTEKYLKYSFPFDEPNIIKQITDSTQKAKLTLLSSNTNVLIELIEPLSESSLTYNFLKKHNDSLHHLCYEVENIDVLTEIVKSKKIKIITPFFKAPLFNNKKVVFGYTRNKNIIEFLILNS